MNKKILILLLGLVLISGCNNELRGEEICKNYNPNQSEYIFSNFYEGATIYNHCENGNLVGGCQFNYGVPEETCLVLSSDICEFCLIDRVIEERTEYDELCEYLDMISIEITNASKEFEGWCDYTNVK